MSMRSEIGPKGTARGMHWYYQSPIETMLLVAYVVLSSTRTYEMGFWWWGFWGVQEGGGGLIGALFRGQRGLSGPYTTIRWQQRYRRHCNQHLIVPFGFWYVLMEYKVVSRANTIFSYPCQL